MKAQNNKGVRLKKTSGRVTTTTNNNNTANNNNTTTAVVNKAKKKYKVLEEAFLLQKIILHNGKPERIFKWDHHTAAGEKCFKCRVCSFKAKKIPMSLMWKHVLSQEHQDALLRQTSLKDSPFAGVIKRKFFFLFLLLISYHPSTLVL
jgi:hypothetical protein